MQSPTAGLQMLQPGRAPDDPARRAGFVATLAFSFGWWLSAQVHAVRQSKACIARLDPRAAKAEEERVSRASTPKLCMRHLRTHRQPSSSSGRVSLAQRCASARAAAARIASEVHHGHQNSLWLRACVDTLRSAAGHVMSSPSGRQVSSQVVGAVGLHIRLAVFSQSLCPKAQFTHIHTEKPTHRPLLQRQL
ncbi:hypothetical protein JOL62DRAFT_567933 [Phyllosticta paracitricarpa]|uniref:Uncharacterized protein n=1 Tax=Phyllosticta paracitricarpa TaxID=2016321 RepID=A0ABR1NDV0_9PEZI